MKTWIATVASAALAACAPAATPESTESVSDAGIGSGSSALSVCPATNVIADPPQFSWDCSNSAYCTGTMEVGQATFNINGQTLTTRAYRQAGTQYTIPGPTMKMQPGKKYVMRLQNTLPYQALSTSTNVFKDPNVVNLHTHGLHISGESPSDDVTRSFEGQRGGDFVYDIPANHMGGTYWYHAHHHGSTYLQVSGGMFGQLIVDDANDGMPANVAAMAERQLVVAYLDPGVAGTGGDTLMSGTLTPTWTVNGAVQGSMCIPGNEWQHWRVLLADRDSTEKSLGVGANCEVAMLARDGVWRTTAPKVLSTRAIRITGASRVDLAVRCTADSTITVDGATVANVVVSSNGTNTSAGPYSSGATGGTWSATRPDYLRDLRGITSVHKEAIRMGARAINGVPFNHDVPNITLNADQTQEWTLNGSAQHPFHLHVYHVQSLGCGGDYETGEFYDVMSQGCTVRFDMNAATSTAYAGRTIMHCHILAHEDQGAMAWMDVIGGVAPPTLPAGFSEYYTLGATTPVCGDAVCNGTETKCTCPGDCGPAPTTETSCTDGVSNDCDGAIDCADSDCSANAACVSACDNDTICEAGEDCNNCRNDCPAVTSGKPSAKYCCGDGIMQSAEGDGTICDGRY